MCVCGRGGGGQVLEQLANKVTIDILCKLFALNVTSGVQLYTGIVKIPFRIRLR